jgi:formate hydrogenlyase subunit 6/NADH:ubiquinone oxidoreductase subunit I
MALPTALVEYARRLGFSDPTTTGYKTLERVFEIIYLDREDHIKLASSIPGTPQEIIEETGLPEERARSVIQEFVKRGVLTGHSSTPGQLVFPISIGNLKEFNANWPEAPKELFELMQVLFFEDVHRPSEMANFMNALDELSVVRVLPVDETIDPEDKIVNVDSARAIFDEATLISAVPCGCRIQATILGRRKDCQAPDNTHVCLQTNAFAAHMLDRGIGAEKLTSEEAKRRLGMAEDAGLVHMTTNVVSRDNSYVVCNCCSCCCAGLHWINTGHPGIYAPSRFTIKLDVDECSRCGACEDRCPFNLIKMNDEDIPDIQYERCYGCGNCVIKCPEDALTLEEIRSEDHISKQNTYFY